MFPHGLRAACVFSVLLLFAGASSVPLSAAGPGKTEAEEAKRIISIGGAVTEILFALGAGDRVVGIDLTSTYPPEALERPQVGYMRALSAEGVLSLSPDLVLAVDGSGPPDVLEVLGKASVPFTLVPEAYDGEGAAAKIRFLADLIGRTEKGEEIAGALEDDLETLAGIRETIPQPRRAVFILAMSTGTPLAAGENTAADGIFRLAGVTNALAGFDGYKPVSDEAVMASEPDAIVIMTERGHEFTPEFVFSLPAFSGTPAARDSRLIALPGSYMLNFGPRTAHAAHDLAALVYPELTIPDIPARVWAASAR